MIQRTSRQAIPWPDAAARPDAAEMLNDLGRAAALAGQRQNAYGTTLDRFMDTLELGLPGDSWTAFEPVWGVQGSATLFDYDLDSGATLECAYIRYGYTTIMRFDYIFSADTASAAGVVGGAGMNFTIPALGRKPTFRSNRVLPNANASIALGKVCGVGYINIQGIPTLIFPRFAYSMDKVLLWRANAAEPASIAKFSMIAASGDRISFVIDYETASALA